MTKHALDVPCPICHAPAEVACAITIGQLTDLDSPHVILSGGVYQHLARTPLVNQLERVGIIDHARVDRTMDLYRDFAKAGIRWTLANRIADAKADALNALDVKMTERLTWLDENPDGVRSPDERGNDRLLLADREAAARELADACAREAEADEALHKMANTLTLELER